MTLEVPEDHSYIHLIRSIGRNILEHSTASQSDVDDIEAVVGELCSNVTRHAQSECGTFNITFEQDDDNVVVTVEDHGEGFSLADVPEIGTVRCDNDEDDRIGGFGLQLVALLADNVEFLAREPHGTVARAEKRLHLQST